MCLLLAKQLLALTRNVCVCLFVLLSENWLCFFDITHDTYVISICMTQAEIMEFVDYLKSPKKYESIGAQIPKGESRAS